MKTFLILATVALVSVKANVLLPAGVDLKSCPNYPYCSNAAPAALPTPVVNGQPVAPILNTTPEQTAFYQQVSLWVLCVALEKDHSIYRKNAICNRGYNSFSPNFCPKFTK